MKSKNNLFLLLFVLLITSVLIAACGNNGEDSSTPDADEADQTEEAEETEDADDTDESEATNDNSSEDAAQDKAIVISADTINSHEVEEAICVVNSRFEQGWRMVFRAMVSDAITGEEIDDADIKVVLEDGQEFEMEYGRHGEDEMLYTIAWSIPEDYTTGTLEYEIIATVDGEEYTYEPFDVEPSKLTIIEPASTEG